MVRQNVEPACSVSTHSVTMKKLSCAAWTIAGLDKHSLWNNYVAGIVMAMMQVAQNDIFSVRVALQSWLSVVGRCSLKSRKFGIRHGIYPGEDKELPMLDPATNNADKLYHYRVTISPPTNFLVKVKQSLGRRL